MGRDIEGAAVEPEHLASNLVGAKLVSPGAPALQLPLQQHLYRIAWDGTGPPKFLLFVLKSQYLVFFYHFPTLVGK